MDEEDITPEVVSEVCHLPVEASELPHLELGKRDAEMLLHMLRGYMAYLSNAPRISPKHVHLMRTLQSLHVRLARLTAQSDAQVRFRGSLLLSFEDFEALYDALDGFITAVECLVPRSAERDDTLACVRQIQDRVNDIIMALLRNDS
jgi:hypothetical protein